MKMCSGLGRVVLINKNKINKLTEWQTEGWTDGQIKNNSTPHLATWGVISVVVPDRKLWWDKASNAWLQKNKVYRCWAILIRKGYLSLQLRWAKKDKQQTLVPTLFWAQLYLIINIFTCKFQEYFDRNDIFAV